MSRRQPRAAAAATDTLDARALVPAAAAPWWRALRPHAQPRESGSGTVWVLAVAVLLVLGGIVAATVAVVVAASRTADTAADLAALSAASSCGSASTTDCGDLGETPCALARRIAHAHRTRLVACSVRAGVVDVVVEVRPRSLAGGVFVVRSRARAGRSGDEGSDPFLDVSSPSGAGGQASCSRSVCEGVRRCEPASVRPCAGRSSDRSALLGGVESPPSPGLSLGSGRRARWPGSLAPPRATASRSAVASSAAAVGSGMSLRPDSSAGLSAPVSGAVSGCSALAGRAGVVSAVRCRRSISSRRRTRQRLTPRTRHPAPATAASAVPTPAKKNVDVVLSMSTLPMWIAVRSPPPTAKLAMTAATTRMRRTPTTIIS